MTIYCIGNRAVKEDSVPIMLMPKLQKAFPDDTYVEIDPTENFIPDEGSVLIDTVEGIDHAQVFHSLDQFQNTAHVSVHDYDLFLHLQLLIKLKKVHSILIIAVPKITNPKRIDTILQNVISVLKKRNRLTISTSLSENA